MERLNTLQVAMGSDESNNNVVDALDFGAYIYLEGTA